MARQGYSFLPKPTSIVPQPSTVPKKAFAKLSRTCNFGERYTDRATCVPSKRPGQWRLGGKVGGLVERLPGRLLLHRRRYNWDDSEDCDNDL
jgi:hypothetical protein